MDDRTPLPLTEEVNPSTGDLDLLDTHELLHRINDEDRRAAWAVERELDVIGTAVDAVVQRLREGGRLHYFGAGTSGRIAAADAAELPPTFSTPADLVAAHIAGGPAALMQAIEGAEDDGPAGAAEVSAAHIGDSDVVVGISASGRTPYVLAAVGAAHAAGALTIGITNDVRNPLTRRVAIPMALLTGAEAVTGSTRMKAAAAQKMALTMLSTAVMVKLGHVHGNLMVDVAPSSAKLRRRALRMTALLAHAQEPDASAALESADYEVKTAVVMLLRGCSVADARAVLAGCDGNLRRALA